MHKIAGIVRMVDEGAIVDSQPLHEGGELEAPISEVTGVAATMRPVPIGGLHSVVPASEEILDQARLLGPAGDKRVAQRLIWVRVQQRSGRRPARGRGAQSDEP